MSKNYEICALVFSSLWPWYGFSIPMVSYQWFGMFLETHTAPTSLPGVHVDANMDEIGLRGEASNVLDPT